MLFSALILLSSISITHLSFGESVSDSIINCKVGDYSKNFDMGGFTISVKKKDVKNCFMDVQVGIEMGNDVYRCTFPLDKTSEAEKLYESEIDIGQKLYGNQHCRVFASWVGFEVPLKYQISIGTPPKDISCPYGLVLIKKSYIDSFACVKPQTAQKLVERGWSIPNK